MQRLVPNEVQGWKAEAPDRVFDRKTIFDYLDGGAEVYLTYDFRRLFSRRFTKPGDEAIIVDIFDMGSSNDAFGVFSFERDSQDVGIGQDSEYAAGLLRFWKSRYFVAITAERDTPASKNAVMAVGEAVAAAVRGAGTRPEIVGMLPSKGLAATSVRYFHTHSALNYHYFLAHENILNLSERTEAVLARYLAAGGKKSVLLLVRYPTASSAASAQRKFAGAYMPEARQSRFARMENGTWSGVAAEGRLLMAVFESPRANDARSLLADLKTQVRRKPK